MTTMIMTLGDEFECLLHSPGCGVPRSSQHLCVHLCPAWGCKWARVQESGGSNHADSMGGAKNAVPSNPIERPRRLRICRES